MFEGKGLFFICASLSFLSSAVISGAAPLLPSFFLRAWQTRDGLPDNAVTAVVQTKDGFLWVGTYDGLARFDGASFTVFDSENTGVLEMRNSRVTSLFEDDDGNLWIGHETGGLTRYKDGRFYPVAVNASWESRKVLGIGSDAAGKIWMLNEEGRLAGTNGVVVSAPNAGSAVKLVSMARNNLGRIWMLCEGQVFELETNRLVPLVSDDQLLGGYVTGVCASRDGGLWLVSGEHVRKWDGSKLSEDLGPAPWGQSSISAAIELHSGDLAVGTIDQGIYILIPHRGAVHFNRENGFPHDWVRTLCEDREGTLWAGTGSGGLVALRAGKVVAVNPPDGWRGSVVLSVASAPDGTMWAGTEGAGLYRRRDNSWTRFDDSSGISNQFVWSVTLDAHGLLWAATYGGGVFVQQGGRFVAPPGLENMTVPTTAVLHSSGGVTWIGTSAGLLRYDSGATKWYGRKDGLSLPDVRCVAEDSSGAVWFGMMGGGLGRLESGKLRQYRMKDGISSDYVQCLHLDVDGTLWIGTYGGGLNRLKDGSFTNLTTAQGLRNNFICDIEEDEHGHLWFSSHGGIFRISKEELNLCADGKLASVHCLSYGLGDGMPTLECSGGLQPAGCKTADGRFWFPTSQGLVVVDPNDAKVNQLEPPVVVEKMLVNGRVVSPSAGSTAPVQIPPGQQRFEFHYAALSFVAPEKVLFRYKLDGLETDWTDAGTKRLVPYGYIPPGSYTFHVIACNSDGIWNTNGASLAFVVEPYIWQQWGFRLLEVLGAASLLAWAVVWITRRRMQFKLERSERQRAVERERARIAQDIHDNLGASLTRISLLSQAAHGELDNPSQAATQLDRIYNTARDLTRSLDEIVWAVNPQHDTLDSLADYLGKFAQDFLGPLNIRCRLDVPVQLPNWPLTAEVRHNLFLAFKEALNNVVKHSSASEVFIALNAGPESFKLILRDNGIGFVPDVPGANRAQESKLPGSGNGLINMRRRLSNIGGRYEIKSSPGQGTEVAFLLKVVSRN